jgi:hypothetical protein
MTNILKFSKKNKSKKHDCAKCDHDCDNCEYGKQIKKELDIIKDKIVALLDENDITSYIFVIKTSKGGVHVAINASEVEQFMFMKNLANIISENN